MLPRKVILTAAVKVFILLVNFGLVVFSTRVWGSEGRGELALVIANVSVLALLTGIFCGSSVAYHSGRVNREALLIYAALGALFISFTGAGLLTLIFREGHFLPLFLITLLLSLTTSISSWWLGKNRFTEYNLQSAAGFTSVLAALLILFFVFGQKETGTYFRAYYFGLGFALLPGLILLLRNRRLTSPVFRKKDLKSIFSYGFNNEFNSFLHFLGTRLSYWFVAWHLGYGTLGVFSIVISVSEAVWIISRSFSAVHFSNAINSGDITATRKETVSFAKQNLFISLVLILFAGLLPGSVYQLVFGEEFSSVNKYILYLAPGICAVAVSKIHGHYFAGIGKLHILRNNSLIGLGASLLLLPLLIPEYGLTGACITLNISYILSSVYIWIMFRRESRS